MSGVNIVINKRTFKLGCDDGEEPHLQEMATHFRSQVEELRTQMKDVGDEHLFLMAGIMLCDELWEARDLLGKAQKLLIEANRERSKSSAKPAT